MELRRYQNSGKPYSEDDKNFAKMLYLQGRLFTDIAKEVSARTGRRCTSVVVARWMQKNEWDLEKIALAKRVGTRINGVVEDVIVRRVEKQKEIYEALTDEGERYLDEKRIVPDRMSEVIGMIDTGIKGERTISSGLVSMKLIAEIVAIISEEVKDDEIRRRIAYRLQRASADVLSV